MKAIDRFSGEYRYLSNFHPSPIVVEGVEYATVEHAYQSAKAMDAEDKAAIATARTPGKAKRMSRKVVHRSDWDQVKVEVMERLVRAKFKTHADLRSKLLATGVAVLIEGNNWNDRFWGICQGQGKNQLGQILMRIRRELMDSPSSLSPSPPNTRPRPSSRR